MSDVKCPYCKKEQEICHDDGYGYEEDEDCEQACTHCDKYFKFTTTITYSYDVKCQDGDHDMESMGGRFPHIYECTKCDHYERRADIRQRTEGWDMRLPQEIKKGQRGWRNRRTELQIMDVMGRATQPNTGWDVYKKMRSPISGDEICMLMVGLSDSGYLRIVGSDPDCGYFYELPESDSA